MPESVACRHGEHLACDDEDCTCTCHVFLDDAEDDDFPF
jgi:hypothetical protein